MSYFDVDLNLTEEDRALKEAAHKFAKEVIRPVAKELDGMTPEQAIADDSPFWPFLKKSYELGYHTVLLPAEVGGMGLSPNQVTIVLEELAWGSFGLALYLCVSSFVAMGVALTGNEELIKKFVVPFCECTDGSIRGCWGATEPDHGSDVIGMGEPIFHEPNVRCNCTAKRDGDEWVINGQKAAWVSGGTVSTHTLLHVQTDPSKGLAGWSVIIVPMDLPGASKGKALDKIGQRDLNQGEVVFEDVRVPAEYAIFGPEVYEGIIEGFLTFANVMMAACSTGLARAAFDEAFEYCKERVQGGRPLMEHYSIKQRIFEMFARVETCRSITRSAANLNYVINPGFPEYSMAAKTTATQMCLDNADDAIQLLGGNGLSKEYLPEKLYRDARATLIEDGNNEILARHGGHTLFQTYPRPPVKG